MWRHLWTIPYNVNKKCYYLKSIEKSFGDVDNVGNITEKRRNVDA